MSETIPTITSIYVACYLHTFIDWDIDHDRYISASNKLNRNQKLYEVELMVMDANMTKEEYEFLLSAEMDQVVSKAIKKGRAMIKQKS